MLQKGFMSNIIVEAETVKIQGLIIRLGLLGISHSNITMQKQNIHITQSLIHLGVQYARMAQKSPKNDTTG